MAQFHTAAPKFGNQSGPKALLEHSHKWAAMIREFGGTFASKCSLLMDKLEASLPKDGSFQYYPGHGNYTPTHVILDDQRTSSIDLDGFDLLDPAFDLACFIVAVERYGLKYPRPPNHFEGLTDSFIGSYLKRGGKDALRNLPFYKGAYTSIELSATFTRALLRERAGPR